jgi:hypothetical protein
MRDTHSLIRHRRQRDTLADTSQETALHPRWYVTGDSTTHSLIRHRRQHNTLADTSQETTLHTRWYFASPTSPHTVPYTLRTRAYCPPPVNYIQFHCAVEIQQLVDKTEGAYQSGDCLYMIVQSLKFRGDQLVSSAMKQNKFKGSTLCCFAMWHRLVW